MEYLPLDAEEDRDWVVRWPSGEEAAIQVRGGRWSLFDHSYQLRVIDVVDLSPEALESKVD